MVVLMKFLKILIISDFSIKIEPVTAKNYIIIEMTGDKHNGTFILRIKKTVIFGA